MSKVADMDRPRHGSAFGKGILALEQRFCGAHIYAMDGWMELKFNEAVGLSRPRMLANFQTQS